MSSENDENQGSRVPQAPRRPVRSIRRRSATRRVLTPEEFSQALLNAQFERFLEQTDESPTVDNDPDYEEESQGGVADETENEDDDDDDLLDELPSLDENEEEKKDDAVNDVVEEILNAAVQDVISLDNQQSANEEESQNNNRNLTFNIVINEQGMLRRSSVTSNDEEKQAGNNNNNRAAENNNDEQQQRLFHDNGSRLLDEISSLNLSNMFPSMYPSSSFINVYDQQFERSLIYSRCVICNNKIEFPKVVLHCKCQYHLECFILIQNEKKCVSCGDIVVKKCDSDYDKCSICLNPLKTNIEKLRCRHSFHIDCIRTWKFSHNENNNKCPICRAFL